MGLVVSAHVVRDLIADGEYIVECIEQREHGRANKEETWPKPKKASTGDKIPVSSGLQQRSQTAKEYAKALGLKPDKMLKRC